jgi:tRNA (mo5U34)-methyltransferase
MIQERRVARPRLTWLSRRKAQPAIAKASHPAQLARPIEAVESIAPVAPIANLIIEADRALRLFDWAAAASSASAALAMDADPSHPSGGSLTRRQRAVASVQLGCGLREQGDAAGAESAFRAAVAVDPEYDEARYYLGRMLQRSSRASEAATVCFEGLKETQSPLLRQGMLELDYSASEIDDCLARGELPAERCIRDDPDFPPCPIADLQEKVASLPWFHSINLGGGIVTPGHKSRYEISREAEAIFSPLNLRDRTVADIGAWNGAFTVEAKRRGAARILAMDHYTWAHPHFRGKQAFDLVMSRLGIDVETKLIDIQNATAADIRRCEVVLFLGVFYHLFNPISALQVLAEITAEVLVLETHLDLENLAKPAMVFYPDRELGGDPTNWWAPNRAGMEALLRAVGFAKVLYAPNPLAASHRGIFHAYKSEAIYREHAAIGSGIQP